MESAADDLLRELLAVAREQLHWQQAAAHREVRQALIDALPSSEARTVYQLCDGDHTFRDMATAAGVSIGTVGNWTKRWREASLVFETVEGRMRHLVSLDAVGLPIDVASDGSVAAKRSR